MKITLTPHGIKSIHIFYNVEYYSIYEPSVINTHI